MLYCNVHSKPSLLAIGCIACIEYWCFAPLMFPHDTLMVLGYEYFPSVELQAPFTGIQPLKNRFWLTML
ncbi:hypothetical protein VNO78_03867 [Psophocarpus tetragonolobus]|uniref:Uncharacterized protein n=1 Tax=Psophocarpus tetragonolobus TaxID=3891 RepID=A0AAN9T4V0_PSOTE